MKKIALLFGVLFLSITIISAQVTPCPVNYSHALDQTQAVCNGIGRNQACYGNNTVNITPFSQAVDYNFDTPGDTADVEIIRSLSLSALDEESGDWGISMIRLLANLDPSQTDDVTMLLFGDVEIESAVEPSATQPIITTTYANLRRYPNTSSSVVSSVTADTELIATGRMADNSWIQVKTSESNVSGWIFADLLDDFDGDSLSVVDASQPYFAPMQAFYFRSGSQLDCASVPLDGILIQTPVGIGRVTVWINEVTIDFMSNTGATALVQTPSDETMSIELLEGDANITSEDTGYIAVEGSIVTVDLPQDDNLSPTINPPRPAFQREKRQSPVVLFDRPIEPSTPANIETIAGSNNYSTMQYNEVVEFGYVVTQNNNEQSNEHSSSDSTHSASSQTNDSQGESTETDNNTQEGDTPDTEDCPGNSCNAPGHNKDKNCPGNSCHNNGNNGNGNNGKGKKK